MTCYTVTTCVISDGSIPSDKGGGGGEFIQTLSPEIRGGGGLGGLKKIWSKKKDGGGGVARPRPYLRIRHCYIVTLGSLSSSTFQALWASIGPRH